MIPQGSRQAKPQEFSSVRLRTCIRATGVGFSAFWRSLPIFPAAHFAKIAKLALTGSNKAIFTLHSPGKKTTAHDVALETAPVSNIFQ